MELDVFAACTGASRDLAKLYAPAFTVAMENFKINTPKRQACFLAQVGHESGSLKFMNEIWGPTPQQLRYERDFAHAWTKDDSVNRLAFMLGNYVKGDGSLFRGHCPLQATGREMHQYATEKLGHDFINFPSHLGQLPWAAEAAAMIWDRKNLNPLADVEDFETITKRINGGLTNYDDRCRRWGIARFALGINSTPTSPC